MANLEEKYKKENLQNHIYNTPDTYVGGCDLICELYLFMIQIKVRLLQEKLNIFDSIKYL